MADKEDDALRIEAGRRLFARPVSFLMGAAKIEQLPEAFPGGNRIRGPIERRQVVADQRAYRPARSGTRLQQPGPHARDQLFPGERRPIGDRGSAGIWLCEAEKAAVKRWQRLIRELSQGAGPVSGASFILIDARHGLKAADEEAMDLLDETAVSYQIVLTKADKCSAEGAGRGEGGASQKVAGKRPAAYPADAS